MSFIDASQFAGTGVAQLFPGHVVHGQTVVDGLIALTPKSGHAPQADQHSSMPAPVPKRPSPVKTGYELLRDIGRVQPRSPVGQAARAFLREEPIFRRARFGTKVTQARQAKMQHIIIAARKQPKLTAAFKAGPEPKAPAGRYDLLKKIGQMQARTPMAKTISLRQLPLARGLEKTAALVAPKTTAMAKTALTVMAALADRPVNGSTRRRPLLVHGMG